MPPYRALLRPAYDTYPPRAPRSEHDAHRPLQPSDDLARIFSWQETRLVSKSLTLSYKRVLNSIRLRRMGRRSRV